MKNKTKKLCKNILIIVFGVYVIITLVNQQKTLNSYKNDKEYYSEKIAAEKNTKEELTTTKENIDSDEFIEEMAREKLDMYLPNEKVYIDMSK